MNFEIEFNADHLTRALEVVRQQLATPAELLGAMGESLLIKNKERHAQGLAPDGTPWKPLAPSTIGNDVWNKQNKDFRKSNSKRGAMHSLAVAKKVRATRKILYLTGEMLDEFHYSVDGDTVRLGFDSLALRAGWHHAGTDSYTISPKKAQALSFGGVTVKRVHHPGLPARPLVGFPSEDAQAVVEEIEDYLLRALRSARG